MNQFANMYPGQPQQPAPQAPTPHAGGFDPSYAPPQHTFVSGPGGGAAGVSASIPGGGVQPGPGFVPAGSYMQPPAHSAPNYGAPNYPAQLPQQAQPAAPQVYAQPVAPQVYALPTPQHYAQPTNHGNYAGPLSPQGGAPAHQAYAQPAPVIDAAYEARMRQAAMGNGRREKLPIGQYTVIVESSEVTLVGPPQGRQQRMFFAQVTVESSSVPSIPVGHKAKISKFLESDFDMAKAMGEFKEMCANFYGDSPDETSLWARHPNWLREVEAAPGPFRGIRLSGSVRQSVGKDKKPIFGDDGTPKTRETWQRIG